MIRKCLISAVASLVLFISLAFSPSIISADLGPETIYSQGGTVQSSLTKTNVSMDYEKVILTYGKPQIKKVWSDSLEEEVELDNYMPVHVSAVFKMKNNGLQPETMQVYFPSGDNVFWNYTAKGYEGSGDGGSNDINNFRVNGRSLGEESKNEIPIIIGEKEAKLLVYQWQETFNPQQITEITIEYDTKSGKDYEFYHLTYVLGTGRGWQGKIKQGEIIFVLPEQLYSYSVSEGRNGGSVMKKIPYKVSNNTIVFSFSDYEPDSNDLISLDVYNFEMVKQIEELKKLPSTFQNTLKIASLFRELSSGPKCAFCIGTASQYAKDYFKIALDKASSKEELLSTLVLFAYGGYEYERFEVNYNDLLKKISFEGCQNNDYKCKDDIYESYEGLFGTTIGLEYDREKETHTGQVENRDFLEKLANKIRVYDPAIAASIKNYIDSAKEVVDWKKQQPPPTPVVVATPTLKAEVNNLRQKGYILPIIIGVGLFLSAVTGAALLFLKKRRDLNKILIPKPETEEKTETELNTGEIINEQVDDKNPEDGLSKHSPK